MAKSVKRLKQARMYFMLFQHNRFVGFEVHIRCKDYIFIGHAQLWRHATKKYSWFSVASIPPNSMKTYNPCKVFQHGAGLYETAIENGHEFVEGTTARKYNENNAMHTPTLYTHHDFKIRIKITNEKSISKIILHILQKIYRRGVMACRVNNL